MKRILFLFIALPSLFIQAQQKPKAKKYPSLLWEISGNGLKKPSYLFGTMHVSSKIAFNLADSFYLGIRNADVVALETNPESWQDDMSKYEQGRSDYRPYNNRYGDVISMPADYFSINTLKFYKYDKKIERSLYSSPSTINNLLYRSYGNESSDFEEDTYLDMYIYQCGKKWGKKVAGVENYGESMKLMQEAYRDAAKDKNKKQRSYDVDEDYSVAKLQEAYRKGNLDQLDSINKLNSFSDAFDEKFMYKRNEIQAASIDSILKTKTTLFVGVGAAHLPGSRGVIEMLRAMGYKLRPVMMGERDSRHKEQVEKLRVPVSFNTETAEDGFFQVDIPGKFFKFGEDGSLDQQQYADMANGSFYMVTRIMTNAWLWGHSAADVYKNIDSLLYENIPGKIISKTKISHNGYFGFDITNKTRRGDIQRYNIFVTPFEVIFFKMGGTGEYVMNGTEAQRFFGSIRLKEYKPATAAATNGWKKYSPFYGGFSVDLPHEPYTGNDGSWIFDAEDRTNGTTYRVIRSDIHNYHFAEEDTFDLGLMAESFAASEFIDTLISRRQTRHKGYPALDCRFRTKKGATLLTKFIIRGPHYYTLVAGADKTNDRMQQFLNSFEIRPYNYGEAKERTDTSLYFTVKSPVFPGEKKQNLDIPAYNNFGTDEEDEEESERDLLDGGAFRSKVVSNDTTGEKIYVSFYKSPRYFYSRDSSRLENDSELFFSGDSSWIVKEKKNYVWPDKTRISEMMLTDTGSSRCILSKSFYRNGVGFSLITQSDTLSQPSSFIKSFFDSFRPADTLKGINPFEKKSAIFFADLMSADSAVHKKAVKSIETIWLDSSDLPQIKKAISWLTWDKKKYLEIKKSLIGKLDAIKTKASAGYLKDIYYNAGDTIELQYAALETLLQQKTGYAYEVFRNIIAAEPPVLEKKPGAGRNRYQGFAAWRGYRNSFEDFDNESFLDELHDSLALTRTILPDLLPLLNLDDYKTVIMSLLAEMIDSNLVKTKDYESYFGKFLIEAKQELKKQAIAEKKKAIKKAEEGKKEKKPAPSYLDDEEEDEGNDDLDLYATLLLPYWDINPAVQPVIRQMLSSDDKKLKYSTLLLMLRNNRPVADTLLTWFAGMDEYRYELYSDLRRMKKQDKFPARYNNHLDLGRSALLAQKIYSKPDTLVYVDRVPAAAKDKKGYIYFYKYKNKKDDVSWKLAMVGLVPEDEKQFEFENSTNSIAYESVVPGWHTTIGNFNEMNFTGFLETKIREDEPLAAQLQKEVKKKLYSLRKSAREFYEEDNNGRYNPLSRIDFGD